MTGCFPCFNPSRLPVSSGCASGYFGSPTLLRSRSLAVAVTAASNGIGVLRIALLSFQVFFQCKRYKGNVGASAIRDFRGAMVGRTDKGLLITTGTFTPDAKKEATRDGAPVLDLIDGEQLCQLLKERGLGVSTRQVEEVAVEAGWFERLWRDADRGNQDMARLNSSLESARAKDWRAREGIRTPDLPITNRLRYHCATRARIP